MKIPYLEKPVSSGFKQIFPEVESVYKPLIPVVVRYRDKKEKVFALVDSGADACLFPAGLAERLGIDIRTGVRHDFTGIGALKTPFFFHEVEILFGRYQVKTKVGFSTSQRRVPRACPGYLEQYLPAVSGRGQVAERSEVP